MDYAKSGGARALPDHLHAPFLHAGFWRRFAAYIIDSFVLGAATFLLYILLALIVIVPTTVTGGRQAGDAALGLMALLFWLAMIAGYWLYFALCESSNWQATLGKLALGLRVTNLRGQPIGFGRASGRYFGKIVSGLILDIGYMMAGWTARKQALHDLMADCCVVCKDGLASLERNESPDAATPPAARAGMPGWAVALIVIGGCFVTIIPVIAILAAIAIPAYQNYVVRAQVTEGVALAQDAERAVVQFVVTTGKLPNDNSAAGLPAPESLRGKYVDSVEIRSGQIIITFGNGANRAIAGEHLVMVPRGETTITDWKCGSPDIKVSYLPVSCRD